MVISGGNYQGHSISGAADVDFDVLDYDNFTDPGCSLEEKARYALLEAEYNRTVGISS